MKKRRKSDTCDFWAHLVTMGVESITPGRYHVVSHEGRAYPMGEYKKIPRIITQVKGSRNCRNERRGAVTLEESV